MTNEIANLDHSSSLEVLPPAQPPSLAARQMLHAHAEMMQTAYELASKMVLTDLVPLRFKRKAEDATAAILYGAELGLNPIQSLQRVVPIHGMPTLEARTMVALLKSRGYRVKTTAQSDESVTVLGVDLDGEEYESTWTIERATRAGYCPTPSSDDSLCRPDVQDDWVTVTKTWDGKSKTSVLGNMKYVTDPQAMLKAKAQAEVCRDMAPDILIGISYTSEELESERFDDRPAPASSARSAPITVEEIFNQPASAADQSEPTRPPVTTEPITERQDAIAEAQAQLDTDSVPTEADEPDEPVNAAQNRKMHALFREADCTAREDRLIVTSSILGFLIDTSAKLTKSEATRIIDQLETWKGQGDLADKVNDILNAAAIRQAENTTTATQEG